MKKITVMVILLTGITVFGQATIDSVQKNIYVDNVHQVALGKSEIASGVKEWIAKNYNNSKYVTRISDEDRHILKGGLRLDIVLKNGIGSGESSNVDVDYDLDVAFKEGRYKIEINKIKLDFEQYSVWYLTNSDIGFYLMTKEEYRKHLISRFENTKGMERAFYKRFANNDKKFEKQYVRYLEVSRFIVDSVYSHLSLIDLSILESLSKEKKDDW